MSETLRWWFLLSFMGVLLAPLCLATFRRLPDRGYTLTKPFALLMVGYLFWLMNSAHILPNSPGGILAALLLLTVVSGIFIYRERDDLRAWLEDNWKLVAGVEVFFFLMFITAVWLRTTVGDIGGTEQPMDLMFVTAATRADHFPPEDPWLSGYTVAYYWFGYLLVAVMGQLASVPTDVAYNIGLGMIASMALVGASGIVFNLVHMRESALGATGDPDAQERGRPRPQHVAPNPPKPPKKNRRRVEPSEAGFAQPSGLMPDISSMNWRPYVFGFAGGLMLIVMGNLVFVLAFASSYGIGGAGFYDWVDVSGLTADEPRGSWYPSDFFQFFGSTRIYPLDDADFRVITEFPMFSFLLGDLHPHVMALPFVLLVVALALSLFRSPEPLDIVFWLQRPVLLLASAVLLGGLTFINTWDVATFAIVVVAVTFVANFTRVRRLTGDLFVQVITFSLPLVALAFIFYIPFLTSIAGNSQVNGLSVVVTNDGLTHAGTRPLHLFLFWGPLFAVVLPFIGARLWSARERVTPNMLIFGAAPGVIIVVAWALAFLIQKAELPLFKGVLPVENIRTGTGSLATQIGDRGIDWLTFLFLAAALGAALVALCTELTAVDEREERKPALFGLTLAAVALLLILGCEFFFVGDVFTSRMNTVFKLYYQAWLLLALSGGFALYYLASAWRVTFPQERPYRLAWAGLAALLLAGAALYTVGGTMNRVAPYSLTRDPQRQAEVLVKSETGGSLHGIGNYDADELAGIAWLNERSDGQDFVIAESLIDRDGRNEYSYAARISAATGLPQIIGWPGHQNQWRDGECKPCVGRPEDLTALYTTLDVNQMQAIIGKYGVSFIYVGPLEQAVYGESGGLAKFQQLPVAFQQGAVTIYRTSGVAGEVAAQ